MRGIIKTIQAGMAELADALDLGSSVNRREGSSPFTRTTSEQSALCSVFLYQEKHPPAPLLLLIRRKARLACLFACKRAHNGKLSLPLFCDIVRFAYLKILDFIIFFVKFCKNNRTIKRSNLVVDSGFL